MLMYECDHCRKSEAPWLYSDEPCIPKNWIRVAKSPSSSQLTFCSWKCVISYAEEKMHDNA